MESGVTVRIDTDAQQAVPSPTPHVDDPLSEFPRESKKANEESAGGVLPRTDATRASGLVSQLKRALRTLDLVRDLAETVDSRFAALKSLHREVQDRANDLESLREEILNGSGQAEYAARLFMSLEPRLLALKEQEQRLRAVETTVAALDSRAGTVTTQLERHVDACEAREALVGHAVEQLGRRAADTINDLETRVDDCDARVRTANETIAHLHEVAIRTLPELHQRLNEADEKNALVDQRITEASRLATSLTALEQRLPEIARCEQELARIDLVVPQVERQLGDLDASVEQQNRALTVNQHRAEQMLDEAQRTDTLVSDLENRLADLSQSQVQLDAVDIRLGQLEQRAAAAAAEFEQTSHARNKLEREVVELQNQLRRMTASADDGAKRLDEIKRQAERDLHERAQRASAVLSELESRLAAAKTGDRLFDRAEQQLEQFDARAAVAIAEVQRTTGATNGLEQKVVELQVQLRRMTETAEEEAKKLTHVTRQAERFRRETRPRRPLSPGRLVFGGIAVALSVAIVALVGSVSRVSRAERREAIKPLPLALVTHWALPFEPIAAVAPVTPAPIDSSRELSTDNQRPPAVPTTRIAEGMSATTGKAAVKEKVAPPKQSVGTGGTLPPFTGALVIESEPAGATAFVNGQPVGRTPVVLKDVRVGSCVVRVEYEGYQRWSTAVSVSSTREAHVTATLRRDSTR